MVGAAGQAMQQALSSPRAGQVTVTAGYNLGCSHVIHTRCCSYDGAGGTAEGVRIPCLELVFFAFLYFQLISNNCFVCFGEAFAEFGKFRS